MLGVLQVDLNARVLAVFLCLEVVVVAIFDLAILADPGPQGLTGTGFDPSVATGSALGAALVFGVASFVGFESAAIYSEECKDPKRTVARATFIAVAVIGVFYALSSWLLANSIGPDAMTNPEALVKGGFVTAGQPDPTTVLFIAGQSRLGAFWGDSASLLFCTLVVVGAFAVAGADPVLKLFTWLTNLGALGVLVLMTLTSFAVATFFRRRPDPSLGPWRTFVAPVVAGLLMLAIVVLGVTNFNVLITSSTTGPIDTMAIVLPALLLVALVVGMAVAAGIRSADPQRYAMIGERTAVEQVEHVA